MERDRKREKEQRGERGRKRELERERKSKREGDMERKKEKAGVTKGIGERETESWKARELENR